MNSLIQPGFGGIDWSSWGSNWSGAGANNPINVMAPNPSSAGTVPSILGNNGMAAGGGFQPTQLGFNLPTAQLAMSGLSTLGGLWSAFQQNKLANKAFKFQRDYSRANLENQTKSYNTQMSDRIASRAFVQGMSPEQAQSYLKANQLTVPASLQGRG